MFSVGQMVVCVNDRDSNFGALPRSVKKGGIYTVAEIGLTHRRDRYKMPCIKIEEERKNHAIWAHRFRPLDDSKLDIFRKLVADPPREVVFSRSIKNTCSANPICLSTKPGKNG